MNEDTINSTKRFCGTCRKELTAFQIKRWQFVKAKNDKSGKPTFGPFCCCKCMANNEELKQQKQKTILKNYGVSNVSKSDEIKRRKEETCIKHFGAKCPFQNKEIMNKCIDAYQQKYGVDNISKSELVKRKKEYKSLQKYGCKNVFQSEEIKKQSQITCINKYGASNFKQSKEELQKSYDSMIKRNKHCIPLFKINEWKGTTVVKSYKVKCVLCNKEYMAKSKSDYLSKCPNCKVSGRSFKEKLLAQFIQDNTACEVITNDRTVLKGCGKKNGNLELDIYIKELNLAFEFNGSYWHKEGIKKDIGYHLYKTNLCKSKGILLIHVSEKDWDDKPDSIKQMIIRLLKRNEHFIRRF